MNESFGLPRAFNDRRLACRNKSLEPQTIADTELREKLASRLKAEPWVRPSLINVTVADGTVDLWGIVDSPTEKQALRVAVEVVPGVKAVNDNVFVRPAGADGWNFATPALPC